METSKSQRTTLRDVILKRELLDCFAEIDISERNKELVMRYINGEEYSSLSRDYNISRERVRQLILKAIRLASERKKSIFVKNIKQSDCIYIDLEIGKTIQIDKLKEKIFEINCNTQIITDVTELCKSSPERPENCCYCTLGHLFFRICKKMPLPHWVLGDWPFLLKKIIYKSRIAS